MATDLASLQNLVKRDPSSYRDEFDMQYAHYASQMELLLLQPGKPSKEFADLVLFLAHTVPCYPRSSAATEFPARLMKLLSQHATVLDGVLRHALVAALTLLRNRGLLDPTTLLPLFFELFRVPDKHLRRVLFQHVVSDIRTTNLKQRNNKLNRALQAFLYRMIDDESIVAAKKSLDVLVELYRRQVWQDDRTVNVIATACLSKHARVSQAAVKFFIGADSRGQDDEDGDDSEDDAAANRVNPADIKQLMLAKTVSKKKKKRSKAIQRAFEQVNRAKASSASAAAGKVPNFAAIELIHDPQGFSEKMFKRVKSSTDRFETRLMYLDFVSRLIATHKLVILSVYPFFQRYMQPHQQYVTNILAFAAQSCHEMVPPSSIEPLLVTLANHFVADHSRNEVITVGLNTIREMCTRCPEAMSADLLQDLVKYRKWKDKGVVMAARSLLATFREFAPELLARRDRGKDASANEPAVPLALRFGQAVVHEDVPGVSLLASAGAEDDDDDDDDDDTGSGDAIADDNGDATNGSDNAADEEDYEDDDDDDDEEEEEEAGDADVDDVRASAEMIDDSGDAEDGKAVDAVDAISRGPIAASRLLTDEDFRTIERIRMQRALAASSGAGKFSKKRAREILADEEEQRLRAAARSERVNPVDLEGFVKRQKQSLEERLDSVRAGREGREKFGSKRQKKDPREAGTNNAVSARNKPFLMVQKSRKSRAKMMSSLREKQLAQKKKSKQFGVKRR